MENEFKESLKIKKGDMQNIKAENNNVIDKKIACACVSAIEGVQATTKSEYVRKVEMMMNINKYIENYEELRPVLTRFFAEKHNKEKWEER